ncbi:MAG: HlyD family efflux transporter periplasmic adaptor subunit [Gemmatimonadota bacterium]|nr:HlyD family efflux transporter periplasmic adaptor subunit [Gemmatimonadota bacterium]
MTIRHLLGLGVGVLSACTASTSGHVLTASGTIEATEADLAFQAPGKITEILVREGDRVQPGQTLSRVDHTELEARRAATMAQVAVARAVLAELRAGARSEEVSQARLAVGAADQRLAEQARETARTVKLADGGAVSQEVRERAETALALAQAERSRLVEQLTLLLGGSRAERITAQQAQVAQAEALVAQLDALLAQQTIVAPFAGIITQRLREPGEVVSGGMPVLRLLDPTDRWVRVYVRQDEVGRLSLGQRASLLTDAFPGQPFEGVIATISAQAEFTPRNVQTREERIKLVHAVRIRILGDTALVLKPGLAADVTFATPLR